MIRCQVWWQGGRGKLYASGQLPEYHDIVDTINWTPEILIS